MRPVEEQGYVIVAVNSPTVDYVGCATRLANSVKHWDPGAKVCLITDQANSDKCFDYVQLIEPKQNPFENDAAVFELTPFRETIKLEADMLIVSPISHWWTQFRHRDVVISTGCRTWQNVESTSRYYRQVFDFNDLPDVYNAITYWRLSNTAQEFFKLVKNIFANWDEYKRLIRFADQVPSTDLVYAMAAQIIGADKVTMPWSTYPKIVHMKKLHAGTTTERWPTELVWEYQDHKLRVQTVEQFGAFHYHCKDWQP